MEAYASQPFPLPPTYADYFQRRGLRTLMRDGMYTLRETYELLHDVFGYESHYVNFGYWPDGVSTVEPGRQLALLLGRRVGLQPGDQLLDAGCGLGQTAVDLTETYGLSGVLGVNPCEPQVRFARHLVASRGLQDVIHFDRDCANRIAGTLPADCFDHAIALECFNYFPDPLRFLVDLRRVLRPGGRFAFCVVTSERPQSRWERRIVGLVSAAPSRPGSWFTDLLEQAGYHPILREDITQQVLPPAIARARQRVAEDPSRLGRHGILASLVMQRFGDAAERAVNRGNMHYELFSATAS